MKPIYLPTEKILVPGIQPFWLRLFRVTRFLKQPGIVIPSIFLLGYILGTLAALDIFHKRQSQALPPREIYVSIETYKACKNEWNVSVQRKSGWKDKGRCDRISARAKEAMTEEMKWEELYGDE